MKLQKNLYNIDNINNDKEDPLKGFGVDLTLLAKNNELEEHYGREKELTTLMEILVRYYKNNPLLIGEPGIGKTAIVELFAQKIIKNLVPFALEEKILISLNIYKVMAGAKFRTDLETRLDKLTNEFIKNKNIIVFIDDIHIISGGENAVSEIGHLLKPMLIHKDFQCIGATTPKEYNAHIEKDRALMKTFQTLLINEPTTDETITLLNQIKHRLDYYHNVEILPEAIKLATTLSSRFITDKFLPEKALDILDKAAAHEVIKLTKEKHNLIGINSLLNNILTNIGKLRLIAFRKKDIASEFLFQEIENAYRNFFLRWLNSSMYTQYNIANTLSPLSNKIFNKIKIAILKDVDKLIFSSINLKNHQFKEKTFKNLSLKKNKKLFNKIYLAFYLKNKIHLSLYRISIFLLICWKYKLELFFNNKNLIKIFNNFIIFNKLKNFYKKDFEIIKKDINKFNEKDQLTLNIFNKSLKNLQPILRKVLVNFLKTTSFFELKKSELKTIYALLGYSSFTKNLFSTNIPFIDHNSQVISEKEIRNIVSEITTMPFGTLSQEEYFKLINLESILHKRVIGQEEAISAIANAVRRARLGIQNPNRPLASFLFCGPTGVGKTEITKTLAEVMFGSENEMIRFDMSEFMEKFNISRLIGSPPGYIGFEEGGQLTEAVKRKPYCVILFDELEKAHKDISTILLQVLEDGKLTDSKKQTVNLNNTLIVMTSNIGSEQILDFILAKTKEEKNLEKMIEKNDVINNNILNNFQDKPNNNNINSQDSLNIINFLKSSIITDLLANIRNTIEHEISEDSLKIIDIKDIFKKKEIEELKNLDINDSINFKNTTDISNNLKAENLQEKNKKEDIENNKYSYDNLKIELLRELEKRFSPEFVNRIDNVIMFLPLTLEDLNKIFDILIKNLNNRLIEKQISLIVDDSVKASICLEAHIPEYGARPLRRAIINKIENSLTDYLLKNPFDTNSKILKVTLDENNNVIIQ
jgi:ATP-dependent Clp protease ATP-binding subunit ClpA